MSLIGLTPVDQMMQEQIARQKARNDWAYRDEMRKLEEANKQLPSAGDPSFGKPTTK